MSGNKDTLYAILDALADTLHRRLQSGEITAAELRVALDLCRHCGIRADANRNASIFALADALPNVADLSKWRERPIGWREPDDETED